MELETAFLILTGPRAHLGYLHTYTSTSTTSKAKALLACTDQNPDGDADRRFLKTGYFYAKMDAEPHQGHEQNHLHNVVKDYHTR